MAETKTMSEWAREINQWAHSKGWWSRPTDTIPAKLLLIHSEVSEAAECLRDAGPCPHGAPDFDYDDLRRVETCCGMPREHMVHTSMHPDSHDYTEGGKPLGFATEIADVIIRCLDLCAQVGIDPDEVVRIKMQYNATREQRHGGRGF